MIHLVLKFFPLPFFIGVLFLMVILTILRRRKSSFSYLFFFSVFWIYLLCVMGFTLFPVPIIRDPSGGSAFRQSAFILSRINWAPFDFSQFRHLNPTFVFIREIVANILLTIPFGFGICFIFQIRAKYIPLLALAVGVGIETTQLVMCLALDTPYRGVDINDVILNALGAMLGYGLFRGFSWLFVKVIRRYMLEPKGIFAYMYTITN